MAATRGSTVRRKVWKAMSALLILLSPVSMAAANSLQTASPLAEPGLRGSAESGPRLNIKVKSLLEVRWENVVRQEIEVGCGAASLATILTHYFDFPTTEEEMFHPLLAAAEARARGANVMKRGFSMLEIRQVAGRGGLAAAAFRLEPEELPRVRIPVITRIKINGFDHFVVLKETYGGRVYVADPFYGNTTYRLNKFTHMWSGVVMGFARRNQGRPLDHSLLVAKEDEWGIDSNDIMRLASNGADPFGAVTPKLPVFTRIDLFDFVTPQINGLGSALPSFLTNSIEF